MIEGVHAIREKMDGLVKRGKKKGNKGRNI